MEQVEEFKGVCSRFFARHPEEIIGELVLDSWL